MPLNPVQVRDVQEMIRPMIEEIILLCDTFDTFIRDYDNQQTPIPNTGSTPLDDNADGTAPRSDAPTITGAQVGQLRTFVGNMRAQVSAANLNALIELLAQPLAAILRRARR